MQRTIIIAGSRRYTFDNTVDPQTDLLPPAVAIEKAWVEIRGEDRVWSLDRQATNYLCARLGLGVNHG